VPSKIGTCPLCGEQRELTKEHVVPAWMLRDMRDKLTWIAPELGVVRELVVPVCRACNTWMNRRIETPAMPLLRSLNAGTERVLTSKQQMRLAVWFTKSYMMYDIAGDPDLVTPHPHYIEFRRTGRPTPGSRLWIGYADPLSDAWPTEKPEDRPLNYWLPYGSITRAMLFGRVFAFLVRVRGRSDAPPSIEHPWFSTYLRPIHPYQKRINWPGEWVISRPMDAAFRLLYPVEGMRSRHSVVFWKGGKDVLRDKWPLAPGPENPAEHQARSAQQGDQ
jgi:hypothetical protein